VIPDQQILARIAAVREPLEELLASFAFGKVVHEGLTLAIVGAPNVGKSSLFNRLVERERAIVTATPGTTRDLVTETVSIGGIPVRLVDTAGIRTTADEAESIGVRKSMEALAEADLALIVLDLSTNDPDLADFAELLGKTEGRARLVVVNKVDLVKDRIAGIRFPQHDGSYPPIRLPDWVQTSALTGEGIDQLRGKILQSVGANGAAQQERGFLTNVRQQKLVEEAMAALDEAAAAVPLKIPHEMILLNLYSALRPLDDITGATTADDILNLIFSSFCIGK
jgi:tRNA modification GTPase